MLSRGDAAIVGGAAVISFASVALTIKATYEARRAGKYASPTDPKRLIGQVGTTTTALTPRGSVLIAGEQWSAVSDSGSAVPSGESVIILEVEGLVLKADEHTSDNAPYDIDFLVYLRVVPNDAQKSVLEVVDYTSAVIGIATTTLRSIIGEMPLDDVLSQRDRINEDLRLKLDEITARLGHQERVRRAAIIEAEGTRQAAITVAEGEKQSAILKAEGARQADILSAEGDQQAAVLRAEGFSLALTRSWADSSSTKFIFPMEFTSLLHRFTSNAAGQFQQH
ncbi:Uncharacterized protein Mb1524 [Geodia barretti]|uniref:Uncharacterized protein Mb1524 n=1 Tax=Geodia barretti TaxID=519541 RepID=A0AA35QUL7_GEOBA|nr:Uncharacterized protein Mb1524 [Geodia barretti]